MPPLIYGRKSNIRFNTDSEFYEALGFLSKNDGTSSVRWEPNEIYGAWGSEGRVYCHKNLPSFPAYFSRVFTNGWGTSVLKQINCNDYIKYIANNHGVVTGDMQNVAAVRATIPILTDEISTGGCCCITRTAIAQNQGYTWQRSRSRLRQ